MNSHHKLLGALVAVGALLLAGCGDSSEDGPRQSNPTGADEPVDRAFIAQMIPHHQSAVQMASIAQRRGSSAFVKQLGDDIVRTQTEEIATMRAADRRLRSTSIKNGSRGVPKHTTGMDGDPSTLKNAKAFDRAFLRMMIAHHEGTVVMAKAEFAKGEDRELKKLAQNIITAQQREIREMRKHLDDTGSAGKHETDGMHGAATPPPPGGDRRGHSRAAQRARDARIERRRGVGARDMPYAQADR